MWYLKDKNNYCFYMQLRSESYTVGKDNKAHLKLTHDSTDDCHAKITIAEKTRSIIKTFLDNDNKTYLTCSIVDLDSSSGTFLIRNETIKLNPGESCQLTVGDKLKFGKDPNIYEVKFIKAVVFVQKRGNDTEEVIANVQKLGIKVYEKWNSQCTHYVHQKKHVTHPYTCALARYLWITGPDFWRDCVKAYKNATVWPKVVNYELKIKFSKLNYFGETIPINYNIDRTRLFNGLTFIFFNTIEVNNYGRIVKSAGGNVKLYCKPSFEDMELHSKLLLVITHKAMMPEDGCVIDDDDYNKIKVTMDKMNRRMIHCSEITSAVLKNSIEVYCNQFVPQDRLPSRKRPAKTALVDENDSINDVSKVIVIDDDDDDDDDDNEDTLKTTITNTTSKMCKTEKEKIDKLKTSINNSKSTDKKLKTSDKLKEAETWLSAKSVKKSNSVIKNKPDTEILATSDSPAKKNISLKKLVTLSQQIEHKNEAIKQIQTKLNFNPFKAVYDDTTESSSSSR